MKPNAIHHHDDSHQRERERSCASAGGPGERSNLIYPRTLKESQAAGAERSLEWQHRTQVPQDDQQDSPGRDTPAPSESKAIQGGCYCCCCWSSWWTSNFPCVPLHNSTSKEVSLSEPTLREKMARRVVIKWSKSYILIPIFRLVIKNFVFLITIKIVLLNRMHSYKVPRSTNFKEKKTYEPHNYPDLSTQTPTAARLTVLVMFKRIHHVFLVLHLSV